MQSNSVKSPVPPGAWPWICGLATALAMPLGLAGDGAADILAAALLAVPALVVIGALWRSRKCRD